MAYAQLKVFLPSELNSMQNFSLENIFYSYFEQLNFFYTFGSKTGVGSYTLSYAFLKASFYVTTI